jgi:hypothetical protein
MFNKTGEGQSRGANIALGIALVVIIGISLLIYIGELNKEVRFSPPTYQEKSASSMTSSQKIGFVVLIIVIIVIGVLILLSVRSLYKIKEERLSNTNKSALKKKRR